MFEGAECAPRDARTQVKTCVGVMFADDIVLCSTRREYVERNQWKSEDGRLVEGRLITCGAMNIKTQISIYREGQYI